MLTIAACEMLWDNRPSMIRTFLGPHSNSPRCVLFCSLTGLVYGKILKWIVSSSCILMSSQSVNLPNFFLDRLSPPSGYTVLVFILLSISHDSHVAVMGFELAMQFARTFVSISLYQSIGIN